MKKIFTTTVGFAVMVSSQSVFADPDRISELREEVLLLERLVELKRELAALEKAETTTSLQSASKSQYTPSQDQLDLKVIAQEIEVTETRPENENQGESGGVRYVARKKRTGLYAGGNIGLGFVDFETSSKGTAQTVTADLLVLGGATYGLHTGYSAITSNGLFYAAEAEYNGANIDISASHSNGDSVEVRLDDWWGASFRLGSSINDSPLIGYFKGGYAKGDFAVKYTDASNSSNNLDGKDGQSGWLYGVGFEQPMAKNLLLRGEYLLLDLDEWSETSGSVTTTIDPDVHTAQVGLSYLF